MKPMHWLLMTLILCLGPLSAFAQANRSIQEGLEIMTQKQLGNCVACHELPGLQASTSTFGPSLKGVGARLSRESLKQWVKDARTIQPNTLMPPFGNSEGLHKLSDKRPLLTEVQIEKVVDTLMTWQARP